MTKAASGCNDRPAQYVSLYFHWLIVGLLELAHEADAGKPVFISIVGQVRAHVSIPSCREQI